MRCWISLCRDSSVGNSRPTICGVLIRPGAMQLTVMPCGASCADRLRDQLHSAALAGPAAFTPGCVIAPVRVTMRPQPAAFMSDTRMRSEEHTSELQSLMRISYAVFCLKKKKKKQN